jgi:IS1 family transposase
MFVQANRVQCDEIWSFVYSKQKNVPEGMEEDAGDIWTWTAIESDTKLIISWLVGNRDLEAAQTFMCDLAYRIKGKPGQLTTDGLKYYQEAVITAFGSQIDFAQLVKKYDSADEPSNQSDRKYSPSKFVSAKKKVVFGQPDRKHISTSHVERQNLTMRMHMRRFTRLSNAFSKKVENHCYAVALHFVHYNFVKQHKSLRVTPAMAAGLSKRFLSIEDIVNLADGKMPKLSN